MTGECSRIHVTASHDHAGQECPECGRTIELSAFAHDEKEYGWAQPPPFFLALMAFLVVGTLKVLKWIGNKIRFWSDPE